MTLDFNLYQEHDCDLYVQSTSTWDTVYTNATTDLTYKEEDSMLLVSVDKVTTTETENVLLTYTTATSGEVKASEEVDGMHEVTAVVIPKESWFLNGVNRKKMWDYDVFYEGELDNNETIMSSVASHYKELFTGTFKVCNGIVIYTCSDSTKVSSDLKAYLDLVKTNYDAGVGIYINTVDYTTAVESISTAELSADQILRYSLMVNGTAYTLLVETTFNSVKLYWYDGTDIVKGFGEDKVKVTDLSEIIEVNSSLLTKKTKQTVLICNLYQCYIDACLKFFNGCLSKCLTRPDSTDNYTLEILTMAINVIKYLVDIGDLMRAQLILERITSCPGLCPVTVKSTSGCGCSR